MMSGVGAEPTRFFLLSPADCGGERARLVLSPRASFALAVRLREDGAPLGEVMSFMSGLYFRGKLAYARAFAPPAPEGGALVIAPGRGLLDPETLVRVEDLVAMGRVAVDLEDPGYRGPLLRDARILAERIGPLGRVVLLGSIATDKYVATLLRLLGGRLCFPQEFVGRGDMSRGGLMLRCADAGRELTYVEIDGRARHGPRPPKLAPRRWPRAT
jgi:hypothetical protein